MSYGLDVYEVDTLGFGDVGEMDKRTFQTRNKDAKIISLDNYLFEKFYY